MRQSTITAATLLALATGCGGPAEQAVQEQRGNAAAPILPAWVGSVTDGNRAFGVALYRELASKPGNLFISPISIAGAFGPVIAGAEGETRTAIARALRFPLDGGAALHPRFGGLLRELEREGDGTTLSIANALWVQQGFPIKPAFAMIAREDYRAESASLDFVRAPQDAAARINAWVGGKTRGRIPALFGPDAFDDRTKLVVTNAVYFLGDWAKPFPSPGTSQQLFYLVGGGARQVPLMSQLGQYRTFGTETFQAIDMPYKDERLSMTVFLPQARDGLPTFESGLTAERLGEWLGKLDAAQPHEIQLYLPRLQITESYELGKSLSAMGMGVAFKPSEANFRGIAEADLYISQVVHKTFVRMDEKGTEAAAATGVGMVAVSMPATFRADHPFFFLLRDKRSGAILFMGRIADLGTGPAIPVDRAAEPGRGGRLYPPPPPPPPPLPSPPR